MSAGLFAKKVGMTQVFDESGIISPVTILRAELCKVSQIKTLATDGYNAIQVAYGEEKLEKLNKAKRGHLAKIGDQGFKYFGEFRVTNPEDYKLGQTFQVQDFDKGQIIRLTGTSIGKGFAGNQKRHNFSRGPMTHGSKNHRLPGSIGAGSTPSRVYPGKKMAGQLGFKTTTIGNSTILYIDNDEKILALKGSLPGKEKNILKVTKKV